MRRLLSTITLTIVAGAGAWTQGGTAAQQRDMRVAAAGMGEISGLIVTDEETPQPVKRAVA